MDGVISNMKTIGIWMSDKKSQKLNWRALVNACSSHGYNVNKLDPERPLEEQGHIDVLLHKLTDIIAAADQGDPKAASTISQVEQYLSNHPNITVIDPLDKVRILLNRVKENVVMRIENHLNMSLRWFGFAERMNEIRITNVGTYYRYQYYTILQVEPTFQKNGIFTPSFAEFTTSNIESNIEILRQRGVTFPVICKPTIAHGSKSAHEMIVVFNEKGLGVCKPPCVVQSFVNHNAVLHKVFLIGDRYHICERPSLKNFYASEDLEPIFYSTSEVCKADSQSTLSILDPHDTADNTLMLNENKVRHIVKFLRRTIGLLLAGFDVVIDNTTGNHAVIDINVYPGYDNFPNFFDHLLDCISETVRHGYSIGDNGYHEDILGYHKMNGFVNVGLDPVRYGVTGMNIN